MADYNDGEWHGWNGGECPVHPKTEIEVVYRHKNGNLFTTIGVTFGFVFIHRDDYMNLIVFRVIKPYVEPPEPLERWVNVYPAPRAMIAYLTREEADIGASANRIRCGLFREVMPDE